MGWNHILRSFLYNLNVVFAILVKQNRIKNAPSELILHCEKATKFELISHIVLKLLSMIFWLLKISKLYIAKSSRLILYFVFHFSHDLSRFFSIFGKTESLLACFFPFLIYWSVGNAIVYLKDRDVGDGWAGWVIAHPALASYLLMLLILYWY